MARIQLASNNDDIRGKIGNIVYGKGRSVHTQRKRVKPTNPQTSYQNVVRARFALASSNWKSLSQTHILTWNEAAKQITKSNVFGGKFHPSGFNYYMKIQNLLLVCGQSLRNLPPSQSLIKVPGGSESLNGALSQLIITPSAPMTAGMYLILKASYPYSLGKKANMSSAARIIKVLDSSTVFPYNAWTDYSDHWGATSIFTLYMWKAIAGVHLTDVTSPEDEWNLWESTWENCQNLIGSTGNYEW